MESVTVGIISIILMLAFLLLFEMPVGPCMALCGAFSIFVIGGVGPLMNTVSHIPYTISSSYTFTSIPMYVLLGWLAADAQMCDDMFVIVNKWVGWMRGGLAMAVSLACAGFGSVAGDSLSTSCTLTAIAYPEMKKHGYDPALATGILASGGNLGFMIPPSIAFIVFGVITQTSVGRLFMAGILPGILMTALFCLTIFIQCRLKPELAPPTGDRFNFSEAIKIPAGAWVMIIILIIILGGLYIGIFNPTESGAVGAFATLVFGIAQRRLNWRKFHNSLVKTIQTSGTLFLMIIGAMIFSAGLAISTIPMKLIEYIGGLNLSPYVVMTVVMILFIVLGFLLDIMSCILIMLPITFPMLTHAGFDPVLIGVLVLMTVSIGEVTPPIGIVVFAVAQVVPEVPMKTIFKGCWPFFGAMVVCLLILIIFPQISLIIPNMMFGVE